MMLLCILLPDGAAAQGGQAGAEEREDGLEDEQLRVGHGFDAEDGEGDADDAGDDREGHGEDVVDGDAIVEAACLVEGLQRRLDAAVMQDAGCGEGFLRFEVLADDVALDRAEDLDRRDGQVVVLRDHLFSPIQAERPRRSS